jgi:Mg2+ and Co2+ transporter CorA
MSDLVYRLMKRAQIRRSIPTRKSVQNNEPDRIADLLEEAADKIYDLTQKYKNMHNLATQAMSRVHQLEKERNK